MSNNLKSTQRPRVVVLYACSGSQGHKILADNYAELMRSLGMDVITIDVFQRDGHHRFVGWIATYFWLLKFTPGIWRYLYRNWSLVPGINFIRQHILPRRFNSTRLFLESAPPDLVLSTHPIATAVANFLKRRQTLPSRLWVAFSDWHVQPFWIFPNVDQYLVPIEKQRRALEQCGTSKEKVSVVGMLLHAAYYQRTSKHCARNRLNLKIDDKIILVIGGGKGWVLESLIDGLKDIPMVRIIVSGSSQRQKELQKYVAAHAYTGEWQILGWIEARQYLVAADVVVAKPGGLTTAEALHLGKPLILCGAMPGHEEENARILSEFGVVWALDVSQLPPLIEAAIQSSAKQVSKKTAGRHLLSTVTPNAVIETLKRLMAE